MVISNNRTSHDHLATLKVNCGLDSTVEKLIEKLEIGDTDHVGQGRPCTGAEHRSMLGHITRNMVSRDESSSVHGKLLSNKNLADPNIVDDKYEDDEETLKMKISYLNLLLTASRRSMIFSQADTGHVFHAGAAWGAKCGMSDSDNDPGQLHYQVSALHHSELVHTWVQHGHDGLPQRAGFSVDSVIEVNII